jgi:hypothetical protein
LVVVEDFGLAVARQGILQRLDAEPTNWAISLRLDAKGPKCHLSTRVGVISLFVAITPSTFIERRFAIGLVTADSFGPFAVYK